MSKLSVCLVFLAMVLVACGGGDTVQYVPVPLDNSDNNDRGFVPEQEETQSSEGEGEGEGELDEAAQELECGAMGCMPPTHNDGGGRTDECDPVTGCAPPTHDDGGGIEGEGEGEGEEPLPSEGEGEGEAPLEVAGQEGEGEGEEPQPEPVNCDDGNPCTDDSEYDGQCAHIGKAEWDACGQDHYCHVIDAMAGVVVCQEFYCPESNDLCVQNVIDPENGNGTHCKAVPVESAECRQQQVVTCTFTCPANLTYVVVWYSNQSEELRCGQDPLELSWGELCGWASPSFAFNGRNGDYWGSGEQVTVTCSATIAQNAQHPDGGTGKRLVVMDGSCW